MKVFVVIEQCNNDFDADVYTDVFSTRESAKAFWEDRVEMALNEADYALDDDECVIERDDEHLHFDVYKDGRASEWEVNIWVEEKEVIEK